MEQTIAEFLASFSASQPVLWALLVLGVVASMGLALYFVWEVLLKLLSPRAKGGPSQPRGGR